MRYTNTFGMFLGGLLLAGSLFAAEANRYECANKQGNNKLSFTTTSFAGVPTLSFSMVDDTMSLHGSELKVAKNQAGYLQVSGEGQTEGGKRVSLAATLEVVEVSSEEPVKVFQTYMAYAFKGVPSLRRVPLMCSASHVAF